MRPLVLLWGFLMLPGYRALMGPKEVRGFEGDTVSLQCSYSEKLRKYKKYWCRRTGLLLSRCYDTIYTREDGQEWTQGRVSIQDSPQTLRFNVTLRKLTLPDSGEYLCGVSILGIDETFVVSLRVLPGPCCTPFPTPSFQPLATSFQPKAKAWQSRPPELTSPGVHLTVTTAKQGKKKAKASPFPETSPYEHARTSLYTRTSPYAGASPHALTPPYEETSPHKATSPHAGTSRPSTHLDSTLAGDVTSLPTSSSSSRYRVSSPVVRILAPVLVLLTLLLAAGLAALGKYMLRCRKEVQLASETQRNEKAQPSHLPLGNDLVPEYAKINLAAPKGPQASPKASPSSYKDIRHLGQTSEEEEDYYLEGEASPGPPLPMSEEELRLSTFIPV